MKAPVRLGLYGLVLVAVFAVAGFTANAVVPEETVQSWAEDTADTTHHEEGDAMNGDEHEGHNAGASSLGSKLLTRPCHRSAQRVRHEVGEVAVRVAPAPVWRAAPKKGARSSACNCASCGDMKRITRRPAAARVFSNGACLCCSCQATAPDTLCQRGIGQQVPAVQPGHVAGLCHRAARQLQQLRSGATAPHRQFKQHATGNTQYSAVHCN